MKRNVKREKNYAIYISLQEKDIQIKILANIPAYKFNLGKTHWDKKRTQEILFASCYKHYVCTEQLSTTSSTRTFSFAFVLYASNSIGSGASFHNHPCQVLLNLAMRYT